MGVVNQECGNRGKESHSRRVGRKGGQVAARMPASACVPVCGVRGCTGRAPARLVIDPGQQAHIELRRGVVECGQFVPARSGGEEPSGTDPRVGLVAPDELLSGCPPAKKDGRGGAGVKGGAQGCEARGKRIVGGLQSRGGCVLPAHPTNARIPSLPPPLALPTPQSNRLCVALTLRASRTRAPATPSSAL